MRLIATAVSLAALCAPAFGQDCRFYNQTGQSVDYRPADGELTFFPAYDDSKVECGIVGKTSGNQWSMACEDGPGTFIPGMSEPDKPFVDILVVNNIFFWLKCKETT
jgi:hypothetical protein